MRVFSLHAQPGKRSLNSHVRQAAVSGHTIGPWFKPSLHLSTRPIGENLAGFLERQTSDSPTDDLFHRVLVTVVNRPTSAIFRSTPMMPGILTHQEPDVKHSMSKSRSGQTPRERHQILVVDDEDDLLELVRYNLTKEGYDVTCVGSGEEALKAVRRQIPDLIVLDLMLPSVNGLEVCRRLKADARTREVPVLMLTAKSEESDMIAGLDRGADDYIAKPFSPRVLNARIKALLRRQDTKKQAEAEHTIDVLELSIHPGRHEVTLAGEVLELTYTEFALLEFLAKRPGWAFTRTQIVDAVKGEDYPVTERSVDVQVAGLRKKLGTFGSYIETVRGVGYRFRA
jgi:two-component system alkaline phosphatase synthesis response regulator PhoP